MKRLTVLWAASVGLLTVSLVSGHLRAAPATDDDTNAAMNKVADLLAKGDADAAKKAAKAIADKTDLETFMTGFRPRLDKKGKPWGIGVGEKGTGFQPDGIELMIIDIDKNGISADNVKKYSAGLARAGQVAAAIGHTARVATPPKPGAQNQADWNKWSEAMVQAAGDFSAAAKANNAGDLKKAATKMKENCDSCHKVFK
jgi:hypothetical protein